MLGAKLSAYPPCPRSHRGHPFARRATSPSSPTPATQQKYRELWGPGDDELDESHKSGVPDFPLVLREVGPSRPRELIPSPPKFSPGVITPKSITRTLEGPSQNFRQAERESRTRGTPSALKIIPAPRRHHQDRRPHPHQLPQMPMHRPIPAKHQHRVHVPGSRHPQPPLDALVRLKWFQVSRRTPQPEYRRRPHPRRILAELFVWEQSA